MRSNFHAGFPISTGHFFTRLYPSGAFAAGKVKTGACDVPEFSESVASYSFDSSTESGLSILRVAEGLMQRASGGEEDVPEAESLPR